ncbi:MAG: hypothetical protein AB7Q29_14945 [Vicinamibacterales bacterium]
MMPSAPPAIADVLDRLGAFRLPIGRELAFQDAVAEILTRSRIPFEREYDLRGGRGRIDFYVPVLRLGLELKVKGSPSDVVRQLQRYTSSSEIEVLVLVTGRARLGAMPSTLGGKPLHVAAVWRGQF